MQFGIVRQYYHSRCGSDHIGDLKTQDKDGNMLTACTDSEKAEVLGIFSQVFLIEKVNLQKLPPHSLDPVSFFLWTLSLAKKLY